MSETIFKRRLENYTRTIHGIIECVININSVYMCIKSILIVFDEYHKDFEWTCRESCTIMRAIFFY